MTIGEWCDLGDAALEGKDLIEAQRCFQEALRIDSECSYALYYLSNIFRYNRQADECLEASRWIIANPSDEDDERVFENCVWALKALDRAHEAEETCLQGLDRYPDAPNLWMHVAQRLHFAGEWVDADRAYEKAWKSKLCRTEALAGRAVCQFQLGNAAEGWLFIEEAATGDPDNDYVHYVAGSQAIAEGRHTVAVDHLSRACELDASDALYFFELGSACIRMHDFSRALGAFTNASRLDPENIESQLFIAICHHNVGDLVARNNMFARINEGDLDKVVDAMSRVAKRGGFQNLSEEIAKAFGLGLHNP